VFPLLLTHFTQTELREVTGAILGNRSGELLQVYVDMLARDLSTEDRTAAVANLREACTGTQFDTWLHAVSADSIGAREAAAAAAVDGVLATTSTTSATCTADNVALPTAARTPPPVPASPLPTTPGAAATTVGSGAQSCSHYERNSDLIAPCCAGRAFSCRLCHDEGAVHQAAAGQGPWHTLDRTTVTEMRCRLCFTVQPISPSCVACHKQMATYFCRHCRLFDSTPNKNIYHCQYCNVCRVGQGKCD
jgi:zinc finger-like protein